MARQQRVVETVTCDVCGKETDAATTVVLGWGKEQWELDLCEEDHGKVSEIFDGWIRGARRVRGPKGRPSPRSPRPSGDPSNTRQSDWDYLESLGFKRHRGRRTAAEQEALDNRPS